MAWKISAVVLALCAVSALGDNMLFETVPEELENLYKEVNNYYVLPISELINFPPEHGLRLLTMIFHIESHLYELNMTQTDIIVDAMAGMDIIEIIKSLIRQAQHKIHTEPLTDKQKDIIMELLPEVMELLEDCKNLGIIKEKHEKNF